jgi:hypothetical protein
MEKYRQYGNIFLLIQPIWGKMEIICSQNKILIEKNPLWLSKKLLTFNVSNVKR